MQRAFGTFRSPARTTGQQARHNVGKADRAISATLGTWMLLTLGKRHGGLAKAAAATWGVLLIKKAATGRSRVYEAAGISSASLEEGAGINIETSVTIMRPREELYAFWRDISNLPLVMRHLISVDVRPDGTSHWVAQGPRGYNAEWDASPINEATNEYVAWRSLPGSKIENSGSVHFYDAGDKGTEVKLKMRYVPPGQAYGFAIAKIMNPITEAEVAEDLRRFKHTMETGVAISTQGQSQGEQKPGMQHPEMSGTSTAPSWTPEMSSSMPTHRS